MREVIPMIGARVDVQPFIALAQGLDKAGHKKKRKRKGMPILLEKDLRESTLWLNTFYHIFWSYNKSKKITRLSQKNVVWPSDVE